MTDLDIDLAAWEARKSQPQWSPLSLLDEGQRGWVERFRNTPPLSSTVWEVGRQRGKSFTALAESWDFLSSTPGAIGRYCALTKDSAISISSPILATIRQECPKAQRPRMSSAMDEEGMQQARVLTWPNGSTLWVFGTDAKSFRKGRGPRSDRILLEESAFYQQMLEVEAALLPSLQTTGGKALYFSSPPVAPGHPFAERVRTARGTGRFEHDTFWSNPRIDHEAVIRFECERLGMTREELLLSTYFRREYLAEEVTEESRAAVPAWPSVQVECTKDRPRPQHFDGYVANDWGGYTNDPHAALFAWWDFASQTGHVEGELEARGLTLAQWADALKAKERELWGTDRWDGTLLGAGEFERLTKPLPEYLRKAVSDKAPRQPFLRVCDLAEQLSVEMLVQHGYALLPWEKSDKHLRVDNLNNALRLKRWTVSPKCKRLLEQLHTTVWDEKRKTWVRTAKDHGDLLDCLVSLESHVFRNRDARPPQQDYWSATAKPETGLSVLGGRRSRVTRY